MIKEKLKEDSLEDGKGGKANHLLNKTLIRPNKLGKGGKAQNNSSFTTNKVISAELLNQEGKDSKNISSITKKMKLKSINLMLR